MKSGKTLFVRIDFKNGEDEVSEKVAIDSAAYLKQLSEERYLTAGVFGDMATEIIDGAMIVFEAENLAEAQAISDADPVIQSGLYHYELKQWHVMIASAEK
ncbi:YciI family protein [Enterococcus avium]|uniref:YciI family protein n=1 Tax=Enterococcus avium TaxID=33945 RepID=UPI00232D80CE|nr:YciI family protein [Enterococcus avium]MDB1749407.1 YciI family protein [Enterococcus avium]MDB1753697.1 YciI family protein [Enterococcus avium]MDB1760696.1 YciI family protein [Enterococcus avium]